MSQAIPADFAAALEESDLFAPARVARAAALRGDVDLDVLVGRVEPGNRQGFTVGLFSDKNDAANHLNQAEYQAAPAVLDTLIRIGYDVNEIDEDSVLDHEDFYTALGWATERLDILATRALLSRGARPDRSRSEALYNTIRTAMIIDKSKQSQRAARVAMMLLQAGLAPEIMRPQQAQLLFGTLTTAPPSRVMGQSPRTTGEVSSLMLLALPTGLRHRIPGLQQAPLNAIEEALIGLLGSSLARYVQARL